MNTLKIARGYLRYAVATLSIVGFYYVPIRPFIR